MAQCSVKCSLSLRLPLFFKYLPHGFLRETKELYSPLSLAHLLPPLSLSLPPSLLLYFLWLHFCHFLFFYSPSLPPSFLPAPWLFCSTAKMGPQSVALEPLNCSEWARQYAHLIYDFLFCSPSVRGNERSSATVMLWCIC